MSEVMIQEVKVVTTGFAPEFGQTMGMVFNAVTPSGTNAFQGEGSYLFRRNGVQRVSVLLRLRQHDAGGQLPGRLRPTPSSRRRKVDTGTAARRRADRQEQGVLLRRLGADAPRPVVEQPDHRHVRRSSRSSASSRSPTRRRTSRPRSSHRARPTTRSTAPTARPCAGFSFHNDAPYNSGGGINTLERATDFLDAMDSVAGQLVIDARLEQAERAPRRSTRIGTRARSRTRDSGHRSGDHDHRRRGLRRPRSAHRPGQRRLRLQAEHHAGDRQLHLHPRRAQLQVRRSTGSTSTTSARPRRSSSTRSRRRPRIWPRRAARRRSATRR